MASAPSAISVGVRADGRRLAIFAGLSTLVMLLFALTVAAGTVRIPLREVLAVLTGGSGIDDATVTIVRQVRLPRALTGLLAGAALGVGGLQMQTLFRNPLADPFILGISSGASLGVAAVVLAAGTTGSSLVAGLGAAGTVGVAGAAAVGATAVTLLVLAVSRRVTSPATVLIIGLMVGYATSAIVSVLFAGGFGQLERIRAYIAWGFGSFAGTSWSELRVLLPCVAAGLAVAGLTTSRLNVLLLGDRYAASMGLRVRRTRLAVVISASLLAGATTAFCGPIAFIGVAVPHIARALLRTADHRALVPGCVLTGAAVALAAGIAAQVPGQDQTLPLNAVTALLGAPVVVAVLLRLRRRGAGVTT